MTPQGQVQALRDAAALITSASRIGAPVYGPDDRPVAALHRRVAEPLAAILLVAATAIEQQCDARGLSVANALELAGVVLGADLGHEQ